MTQNKKTQLEKPRLCPVIGLSRKVDQAACFPGDNFSLVPLKTSREKSPCQDSQWCGTPACALQEADFQFTTPPPTPVMLSHLFPLISHPWSALALQLSCLLFLLSLPSSVLLSTTTFYGDISFFITDIKQFTFLCFKVPVNIESHWSWILQQIPNKWNGNYLGARLTIKKNILWFYRPVPKQNFQRWA